MNKIVSLTLALVFVFVFIVGCKKQETVMVRDMSPAEIKAEQAKIDAEHARIERVERDRELAEKYQLAKAYEDEWMRYARCEAARILAPADDKSPWPDHPVKDLSHALEVYLDVAMDEPVAMEDVERVARIILKGDPIDEAHRRRESKEEKKKYLPHSSARDAAMLDLLDFWEKKQNKRISALLSEFFYQYRQELVRVGFRPQQRYRNMIDSRNHERDWPFAYCGSHINHVQRLARIANTLQLEEKKVWSLHATDIEISDFCCDCSGDYHDPLDNEGAYEQYVALGDHVTAKLVARAVAHEYLDKYANGWEPSGFYPYDEDEPKPEPIPILLPENLVLAKEWYKKGGFDDGTTASVIVDALRSAAADKRAEERYDEARQLYAAVGNATEARKMELLAGPNGNG